MKWNLDNGKTPVKRAVIAAFVAGFLVHHFGLVNALHNIDDIGQFPYGYGTGIESGRWLLSILGDFFQSIGGNYNLPYANGLIYLALIAVAAGLVVSLFDVKEQLHAILIGILFAVFPSATSALFFRFTSVYYGISLLLAVLAAWVLEKQKHGLMISALLIAFSLGIYQGYVPVTISIFVLLLIQRALQGGMDLRALVRRGVYYCLTLILGLVLYFLFLKLALAVYGVSLNDYNGMSDMGQLALKDIPGLVYEAFYTFCMMPLKDYCGLANMAPLKAAYLVLAVMTAVLIGYILLKKIKKPLIAVFTGLMCMVFPIAVNFVVIMSPNAWIYTMMLYAFALVPCVPLIVYECLPDMEGIWERGRQVFAKILAVVMAVILFCYAYSANINYTAVYFSNRQVENYANSLVTQIRMTEGFDREMEWAFIGEVEDPLLWSAWDYEMTYGGTFTTDRTLENYSRVFWIWHYIGYFPPYADEAEVEALWELDEVKQMPCWPDEGSIRVIGENVVIKFQNLE